MCIYSNGQETSEAKDAVDSMCKMAREQNQKFNKRKFQTILSADKVNFRGHQKALMRIMDGTSRQTKNKKEADERKIMNQESKPKDIEDLSSNRFKGIRQQEEELRLYEEKVFIENVVNAD